MQIRWSHSLTLSHTCASFLSPFILFSFWSSTALYISFFTFSDPLSLTLSLSHLLSISLSQALTLFLHSSHSPSPFLTFIFHTLFAPAYPFRNLYFSPFPSFILFEFVSLCLSFCLSFSTRPFLLQLALPFSPFSLTHHSETVTLQISATQLGIRFAHFQRPSLVPGLGGLET